MEVKLSENFLPRNLLKESDCCRVCAVGSTGNADLNVLFIPIYEESGLLKKEKLNILINEYLPLKVHQTDLYFPRKICSTCHYSLEKTIQFFDKVSAAQEVLRKIVYQNENIDSEDPVEARGSYSEGNSIISNEEPSDSSSRPLEVHIVKNSVDMNCSNSEVQEDSILRPPVRRVRGRPRKASYTIRCKSADASQLQPVASIQSQKRRGRPPRMASNNTVKPSSVDSSMSLQSVTSPIPDYPDAHNVASVYNTQLSIPTPSNGRITGFSQDANYSNSAGNSPPYALPKRRNLKEIVDEISTAASRSLSLTLTPVFVKLVDICPRMRATEGTDIIMIPPNMIETEPDVETETLECTDSQNETGLELKGRDGLMEVDKLDVDITMDGGVDLDLDSVEFPSAFQESEIRITHVEGFPQVDTSAETQTQADQPLVADNSYSPRRLLNQPVHLRRRGQPGNYLEESIGSAEIQTSDSANSQVLNVEEVHYQTSESTDEILPIVSILNAQKDDGGSRTTNTHKVKEKSLVDKPTPRKRGRPAKSLKEPSAADISSGRKRRNSQSPEWCGSGSGNSRKGLGKISPRGHGGSGSSTRKLILKDNKTNRAPKKGLLKASVVRTNKASPSISPASLDKEHVSESTSTGDVDSDTTVEKGRKDTGLSKKEVRKCPDCDKQFRYNTLFLKHRHSNMREFKCGICGTEFPCKTGLDEHTKSLHPEEMVKPYSCEYCEETFELKRKMLRHRLIHTGGEPHKCAVLNCNRIYFSSMALRNHTSNRHGGRGGVKPVLSSTQDETVSK